jgi:hypothetical protein
MSMTIHWLHLTLIFAREGLLGFIDLRALTIERADRGRVSAHATSGMLSTNGFA